MYVFQMKPVRAADGFGSKTPWPRWCALVPAATYGVLC
jgi:hypothetical protein